MMWISFAVIAVLVLAVLLWPIRQNRRVVVMIPSILLFGSFAIYAWVGSPKVVPLVAQHQERTEILKSEIKQHLETLKTDSKNIEAWASLGTAYMESGRYDAAAEAFKKAVILTRGDYRMILVYAQAQIAQAGGKVTDEAANGLDMVLLQDPKNEWARYYKAVGKLQNRDTENAMKEMKALYRELPDDSALKQRINAEIGK